MKVNWDKWPKIMLICACIGFLLDTITTAVALGVWPDLFAEQNSYIGCLIKTKGLFLGLFSAEAMNFLLIGFIYKSVLSARDRAIIIGLLAAIAGTAVINNVIQMTIGVLIHG